MFTRTFSLSLLCLICCLFVFTAADVFAYVGPGPGLSFLTTLIGFIVAIFTAIFVVIFYPIRKLMKSRKKEEEKKEKKSGEE